MASADSLDVAVAEPAEALGREKVRAAIEALSSYDEDLGRYYRDFVLGEVMSRPGLSMQRKELVIVSALAVLGQEKQLHWHLDAALNAGLRPEMAKEALILAMPFSGWPNCLNALAVLRAVLDERGLSWSEAKTDRPGEASPRSSREKGLETGGRIYRHEYPGLEDYIGAIDEELARYATEYLFGEVYSRPAVDMRTRQMIAVAILTSLGRLPQLRSHVKGALRVGCTPEQVKEVIIVLHVYVGWPAALNALQVAREVFEAWEASGESADPTA